MPKKILVIGGTRFFGITLVWKLLEAGHEVTVATRGRVADPFGTEVSRIRIDRRDAEAMATRFSSSDQFDLVYDQMCYSPLDARISVETFRGRVGRHVMASTIEVYKSLRGGRAEGFREQDLPLPAEVVELDYPWHDPDSQDRRYGAGKRQAEALLERTPSFPAVMVRIGHVLAGPQDFTRRLEHYVRAVGSGATVACLAGPSSFIDAGGIASFLKWVGDQEFLGPVNACCDDPLSAADLCSRVADVLGRQANIVPVTRTTGAELGPFDYESPFVMDTERARGLGYAFGSTIPWLGGLIREHEEALRQQSAKRA